MKKQLIGFVAVLAVIMGIIFPVVAGAEEKVLITDELLATLVGDWSGRRSWSRGSANAELYLEKGSPIKGTLIGYDVGPSREKKEMNFKKAETNKEGEMVINFGRQVTAKLVLFKCDDGKLELRGVLQNGSYGSDELVFNPR